MSGAPPVGAAVSQERTRLPHCPRARLGRPGHDIRTRQASWPVSPFRGLRDRGVGSSLPARPPHMPFPEVPPQPGHDPSEVVPDLGRRHSELGRDHADREPGEATHREEPTVLLRERFKRGGQPLEVLLLGRHLARRLAAGVGDRTLQGSNPHPSASRTLERLPVPALVRDLVLDGPDQERPEGLRALVGEVPGMGEHLAQGRLDDVRDRLLQAQGTIEAVGNVGVERVSVLLDEILESRLVQGGPPCGPFAGGKGLDSGPPRAASEAGRGDL